MGCFGILLSQNSKLSRFLSIWLGTSTILHSPSSPPFKHVLFCWKLFLSLAISPTLPGYNLLVSLFSYIFDFFFSSSLAFFAVTLLLLGKAPWHMPRVFLNFAFPHVIASFLSLFFHLHIQKSISTNYSLHLQDSELQFWKKNCGGVQTSKGVSFCWINLDWEHWSNLLFNEMNAPTSQ